VWSSFGAVIKEGLYEAPERRDELFKVVRFKTTTSGDSWRSLADVVKDFKENQTAIYYALGDDDKQVLASPHLEGYAARGLKCCCSPTRSTPSGCAPRSASRASRSSR
jgi:Molecular chaperone, HSP90 family